MIDGSAVRRSGHLSIKNLAVNLTHPPLSDRRFWVAQAMVAVVFFIHLGADFAQERAMTPIPGFVWTLLLFVPVVYAGMTFGLVGSLGTALMGVVALFPSELLMPHTATSLWGHAGTFVVVLVTAVVLGVSFEETRAAAQVRADAEALAKGEKGFRLAFENNMAPMAVTDLQGHILSVNRAYCEMLGRTEEELVGVRFIELTHPEDRAITEEISRRQVLLGGVDQLRYTKRFLRKDGGVVFTDVARSLARDETGNPSLVVASIRDVTEERTLAAQLAHQALHDPLTGLPNRVLFEDRMAQAHERAVRQGGLGALMMLSLDDFKGMNETHGHHVGDQLLLSLARRLEKVTLSSDTLCRFGDDTFIYLAEGLDRTGDAEEVAKRLLGVFEEPFFVASHTVEQSASMGVVVCDAAGDIDCGELVQDVDTAMHEAKRLGKGRMVLFAPEMRTRTSSSFQLAQDLAIALAQDELSMQYQPIVDLASGEVMGYEALMRWQHPDRSMVPPEVFIPLAEQSDLIIKLGEFALRESIAEAVTWKAEGTERPLPHVAVNISARQFHDPNLFSLIEEVLTASNLAPERLVVEITESVAVSDIDSAVRVIEHLKYLKVVVALDDFGTGYSSLSYLAMLRPNIIKIDRSFVSSAHKSPYADRLLEAMVSLCHMLDMTVLAEGIETRDQLALLRDLGCELGQGYLFSPAVPAERVAGMRDRVLGDWEVSTSSSRY